MREKEAFSEEDLVRFAGEVYDLDQWVYKAVGSDLGRVFSSDRERNVQAMVDAIKGGKEHILRSEVALIGNMARTIQNDVVRKQILTEYNEIMTTMDLLLRGNEDEGVRIERKAELDELNLKERFGKHDHWIICISRTYGCGGGFIGFGLADALHADFYDAEIFSTVLKRLEAEGADVQDEEDETSYNWQRTDSKVNPGLSYEDRHTSIRERLHRINQYHGLPTRDAVFFNQTDLILDLAKRKDFVVMGRCADQILSNHDVPHISIFLTAPEEQRIERVQNINHVDYKTAKKQLREVDRAHAKYYRYFTGKRWGSAKNYDLCINTSVFGVQGTIDFILKMIGAEDKRKRDAVRADNIATGRAKAPRNPELADRPRGGAEDGGSEEPVGTEEKDPERQGE